MDDNEFMAPEILNENEFFCEPGKGAVSDGNKQPRDENTVNSNPNENIQPIPPGMHTVTPHLICAGAAEAIDFYKKAFGAVERSRMPGPDGKIMHASIQIGDS